MAVYTHIDEAALRAFLLDYDLGALTSFEGIQKGVSNSNYHVFTDRGRYILTIFEEHRTRREDLPFLFAYAAHLAGKGIACPMAYLDKHGEAIKTLAGKPAALIHFLEGDDIPRGQTSAAQCGQMGSFTARMHVAALDFPLSRDNDWGIHTWQLKAEPLREKMNDYYAGLESIVFNELEYLESHWPKDVPRAVVHIDLFPDNIFFQNGDISAMIDMYFACTDVLAYDLAIVVNAWCFGADKKFRADAFDEMMAAYQSVRILTTAERDSFQLMCRAAAMRFLLSRLQEWFRHDPANTLMTPHDPMECLEKLMFHQGRDVLND